MSKHFYFSSILLLLLLSCHQMPNRKLNEPLSAEASLNSLIQGNIRFANMHPRHPDAGKEYLKAAAKEQHPFAVVVCCSDSRVAPELLFDQGVGDLFVIRTAGNILDGMEIGSIEYAVEHLGAKLVMVMGHENCGAIKAMLSGDLPEGHIREIVDSLNAEAEIKAVPLNDVNRLDDCVRANVRHCLRELQEQSAVVRERVQKGELKLVGARYDLDELKVGVIQ